MRVRVLGDLEVVVGDPAVDAAVDLGGPKPRTLLALLVAADGRPVTVEHLIDQMWGDDPPARVEASLQSHVARLRRALEPDRAVRGPAQRLRTHAGGYSLEVPADAVDARRFAALVREARARLATDPAEAEGLLTEGLGLWRGTAYAGTAAPSLDAEATRLDELRLAAVEDLWDVRVRDGRAREAVGELEQLVRTHPLRERLWALLATALYRSHRQGDALAALRRAREHLADELGVDPGPELRRLEDLVLRQDPSLDAPAAAAPRADGAPAPAPPAAAEPSVPASPPLFGRETLLDLATTTLREAAAGRGRVIVLSGEPGIGKTRFAEALAGRAESLGFRVGRGGWEAEASPPLWGWRSALTELWGDTDVLDPGGPGDIVDAASASFRQGDALAEAVRGGPPSLIVLDDVHWADAESLRLLRRTATFLETLPLVVVVATRSAEAEIGPALAEALAALARRDPLRLVLTGLGPEAIAAWVGDHAGVAVTEDVAGALVERTDGNPFHVTELVRLLVREGALTSQDAPAWRAVPGGVRDVVRQRLAELEPVSARVLAVAAVVGRSFDVVVVGRAAGSGTEGVDDAVESALMLGLVEVGEPGRYRFSHVLVRDAVYEGLAAPARARAHADVALALEDRYAGQLLAHVGELAEHYRLAGPAHARSAWVFARRAAHAAAEQSAHDEALRLFEEAAALQDLDPSVTGPEREEVLVGRAVAVVRLGRPIQAWPSVARATESALARDDVDAAARALLTVTTDTVWGWRNAGDWDDDAVALWSRVLDRVPEAAPTHPLLMAALAVELLYKPGTHERSTRLADAAVQAVRRSGTRDAVRLAVLGLAVQALLRPDLLHHRLPLHDELIDLATRLGDHSVLAGGLTARASDRVDLGRFADARADLDRAEHLARRHRLPQNLLVVGWCRSTWQQMEGDFAGAEATIGELEALQATLAMAGEGIGLCQRAILRWLQGRLPELEPALGGASAFFPLFREVQALALVSAGRLDEARALLGAWSDQPPLPWDYLWAGFTAVRAYTWAALGDPQAVADLRADLTPFADRFVVGSLPVFFLGNAHQVLGDLAAASGDLDAARDHLTKARAAHEEAHLPLWVARSDEALAALPGSA
jgi:DNA-binding SARP family transcriptional activator/tetratricopeptide (TPR) repeat protein